MLQRFIDEACLWPKTKNDQTPHCNGDTKAVQESMIRLALLDEATSNISLDVEDLFYNECLDRGLTLVSVAHRKSLRKFHQMNLELGLEDQQWRLSNVESSETEGNHLSEP